MPHTRSPAVSTASTNSNTRIRSMLRAQLEALLLSGRQLNSRTPARLAAWLFRPAAGPRDKSSEPASNGLLAAAHELGMVPDALKDCALARDLPSTYDLPADKENRSHWSTTVTTSSTATASPIMNVRSMTLATTALARKYPESAELAQRMLAMG